MQTRIYAKAALLDDKNRVLLLTRSDTDDKRPGELDFPGGEIEKGEDVTQGIIREIFEEAGIEISNEDLALIYAATTAYDDMSVTRVFFVGSVSSTEVRLSPEHSAYIWKDLDSVLKEFEYHFYTDGLRYAHQHGLLPK